MTTTTPTNLTAISNEAGEAVPKPSNGGVQTAKIDVKVMALPVSGSDQPVGPEELTPIFHRWIRDGVLEDLLIDVADYSHVPNGPGVLLIGHDAQYGLDQSAGRLGLLYSRRRETHPSRAGLETDPQTDGQNDAEGLASAIEVALEVCALLEVEESLGGRLRFSQELEVRINDRLAASNDQVGEARWLPALEGALAARNWGGRDIRRIGDPRGLLTFSVR